MIDIGTVKPGSTIRIPWGSFAGSTGAPSATTNYAAADVQIYKDGGTTQRASASGITASTDFDSLTGVNVTTIDLSDNTTADFYAAGSEYLVVISDVTIDSQTMRFPIGRFRIGYPGAVHDSTIATRSSAISFTLTAGSADDDAYNGCPIVIHDAASAVQMEIGVVSDYTGSTKTVTLAADPGVFTTAAKDNVSILPKVGIGFIAGAVADPDPVDSPEYTSTGTPTTTEIKCAIGDRSTDADAEKGKVVRMTSGATKYQQAKITASSHSGGILTLALTPSELKTAPTVGDKFVIIGRAGSAA